jgi:glutamate-5-semialdehyde dehydrogenase
MEIHFLESGGYMDIKSYVLKKAKDAKKGARAIATASSDLKNNTLIHMAAALRKKTKELQRENKKDLIAARKKGLTKAMIDRLTLRWHRGSSI